MFAPNFTSNRVAQSCFRNSQVSASFFFSLFEKRLLFSRLLGMVVCFTVFHRNCYIIIKKIFVDERKSCYQKIDFE